MDSNVGGAGGFNEGLKVSSRYECDWVWLMDDDTIVLESTLKYMLENEYIIKNKVFN